MSSSIEWTDETWNPVTGCRKVSQGCAHCYAEGVASRFWGDRPFTDVRCHPERLDAPLRWRKPRRVFVNSMSDLFHEAVTDRFVADVFGVMAHTVRHTFQVLTKRPERMRDVIRRLVGTEGVDGMRLAGPLPNVWLGVSVEDQATADERIPLLLDTPAAVRFVSYEPALGPVNFRWARWAPLVGANHLDGLRALDWIIVGGESGPGARPFDLAWARSVIEQGRAAGVPVFVKQLGPAPVEDGELLLFRRGPTVVADRLRDRKGADPDEWPADLRVREFPEVAR